MRCLVPVPLHVFVSVCFFRFDIGGCSCFFVFYSSGGDASTRLVGQHEFPGPSSLSYFFFFWSDRCGSFFFFCLTNLGNVLLGISAPLTMLLVRLFAPFPLLSFGRVRALVSRANSRKQRFVFLSVTSERGGGTRRIRFVLRSWVFSPLPPPGNIPFYYYLFSFSFLFFFFGEGERGSIERKNKTRDGHREKVRPTGQRPARLVMCFFSFFLSFSLVLDRMVPVFAPAPFVFRTSIGRRP